MNLKYNDSKNKKYSFLELFPQEFYTIEFEYKGKKKNLNIGCRFWEYNKKDCVHYIKKHWDSLKSVEVK